MKNKILVVEDDADINGLLGTILSKNNFEVQAAYSGTEALMYLRDNEYDGIILDLMLPGVTGEELLYRIRKENRNMPIIICSAKVDLSDKVNLFKLGADDYITKPFEVAEVLVRVESAVRRYKNFTPQIHTNNLLTFKNVIIDLESLNVTVNGENLNLTGREFSILKLLVSNPAKVFTKESIYSHVWNDDYYGEDNTVNVHISNIRNKLSKVDPDVEYIKTVWGIGFKMSE